MPNIVTNRLNSQFDLAGPSFSVSAEEASGPAALALGCRALRAGEVGAVVVGAADLSCEPVHEAALRALGRGRRPGDAAVVLVLRRRADAERDGADVIAVVDETGGPGAVPGLRVGPDTGDAPAFDPVDRFGSAHAAEGLVAVAAAALAVRHRAVPRPDGPAAPLLGAPVAEVMTHPLGAAPARVRIRGAATAAWSAGGYAVHRYTGRDRRDLADAVRDGRGTGAGPCRLALVERPGDHLADRREAASRWLRGTGERPAAVAFRDRPAGGEVAFVYPNGSACHPRMGRSLMLAFPDVMAGLAQRCGDLSRLGGAVFDGRPADPVQKNLAATLLGALHTRLTRDRLGIRPDAVLGYSSGEAGALVALDVWRDIPALVTELTAAGCFTDGLVGEQRIARRAWDRLGLPDDRWVNLVVAAPPGRVEAALRDEPAAFLLAVNTGEQCVVGGAAAACARVARRLGDAVAVLTSGYDIAAHAPLLGEAEAELRRLYRRPVHPGAAMRFYTGTTGGTYVPTAESVAGVLTALTLDRIDFAATVRRAWDDGVRVFVEHGPRNLCTDWISAVLGDRDHLAVALDRAGEDSLAAFAEAVAELTAAGVCAEPGTLVEAAARVPAARSLVTPAHPPLVAPALARLSFTAPTTRPSAGEGPSTSDEKPAGDRDARPPEPLLDREQLERLAEGEVPAALRDRFAIDGRTPGTRLPEPPLLPADRVLDISGEPCPIGKGTIRTETDVRTGSWYVDGGGRMPAGLVAEGGQADLLLLAWLGADRHAGDGRVYRPLGMDLTFHGSPPPTGTTARYDVSVDGPGEDGEVPLFFFHSRCEAEGQPLLTVDNGHGGYFTAAELARAAGVDWTPATDPPEGRWCPPAAATKTSFGFGEVRAFAEGRPDACFGPGWAGTRAHLRTPRPGSGRLQLLHRVPVFDPAGGPWRRGYLRAEFTVSPQEWFFTGRDPRMPGTLMFEACLQAMAFHLAACGHTRDRDGWRFEPVPGETFRLRWGGQVTPRSRRLTYELFVSGIDDGPQPALFADALCTVDGVKAFHARRLGLRLAPGWPLDHWRGLAAPAVQPTGEPVPAERLGGLLGEPDEPGTDRSHSYADLLTAAWGRPAAIRLPGPPYLFVSRIRDVDRAPGATGSSVVAEYDLPGEAWFWTESGSGDAPLCVLAELAVQPCSWLLGQTGLAGPGARLRNLGGTLTVHRRLRRTGGVVRTTARLTGVTGRNRATFAVTSHIGDEPLLTLETTIAPVPAGGAAWPSPAPAHDAPDPGETPIDLRTRPPHLFAGRPRLPGPMLAVLDRVTGFVPDGGAAGLGWLRAEKDVDPGDWWFKAHVFGDPALPAGLALEAVSQLLQFRSLEGPESVRGSRFETPVPGHALTWSQHGDVGPATGRVALDLTVTGTDGRFAVADAELYAGRDCVFRVRGMTLRAVPPPKTARTPNRRKDEPR
jgi:3-hydroxymyristoyl/3-hydroxydecanoyl-(acyl carrier protein) dehydratase/malonyl CoA-acyl carrier protein transacylase